jgi:predicted O-methyltransferase YrrM
MTLVGTLAGVLPVPVRNLAIRWRDQWRLSGTPAGACDPAPLGRIDLARVRQVLADPMVDAEWPAVAAELDRFTITTTAEGVNPGDRRALYYLIRGFKPARVLEVGTHIGASTVHIAAALRANGGGATGGDAGSTGSLTTVDIADVNDPATRPWERYGTRLAPSDMTGQMGMGGAVRFVASPSIAFLETAPESFDLIFLDGDHSAATVYRELPAALRRLRPGGLILLHDYFPDGRPLWPGDLVIAGPWLGVERLRREGARLQVLPLGDLRWPTKLGRSVTSLAVAVGAP